MRRIVRARPFGVPAVGRMPALACSTSAARVKLSPARRGAERTRVAKSELTSDSGVLAAVADLQGLPFDDHASTRQAASRLYRPWQDGPRDGRERPTGGLSASGLEPLRGKGRALPRG